MNKKRVIALLLAMCLSGSLFPVPGLAVEAGEEAVPAVVTEGAEPSDSNVKDASSETEPMDESLEEESQPTPSETTEQQSSEMTTDPEGSTEEPTEPEEPVVALPAFPVDSLCYAQDKTVIRVQQVGEQHYLFLPASADGSKLKLDCTLQEGASLYVAGDKAPDGVDATEGFDLDAVATPEQGIYTLEFTARNRLEDKSVSILTEVETVQVMQSAHLSALYLISGEDSGGREYIEQRKGRSITGQMALVQADGTVVYDGELTQIKARGNSTFQYYPKKAYQIKLKKKTALIDGTEKGKTWVLLAGYADAVKLSDQMWKEVGNAIQAPYTAQAERIDLYFDGEYRGSYSISEKNQVNGNRIDITDMEEAYESCNENYGENAQVETATNSYGNKYQYTQGLTDPEQKGGFLLELNSTAGDEASWFKTSRKFAINVKSPEYASQETMRYISEYFQAFEDAVMATDSDGNYTGRNPKTGLYYYDYCDLDSLAEQYLLNCVSSNRDGFWRSLYFYMDTDGLLYAGPLWDMELTLGVGWNNSIPAERDWMAENDAGGSWSEALIQIPSFRQALQEKYASTFEEVLRALLGDEDAQNATGLASIQERAELGRASVAMDNVLWPEKLQDGSPCALYPEQSYAEYYASGKVSKFRLWPEGTSYDDIVQARIQWLTAHKAFLDDYFADMSATHTHVYDATITPVGKNGHTRVCRLCGEIVREDCVFTGTPTAVTAKAAGVLQGTCQTCGQLCSQPVTLEKGKTFISGNLAYQVTEKDQTVTVTKGKKKSLTSVSIPDTVSYGGVKYRVTAIGKKAFCQYTKVKTVHIGANVATIGQSAFAECQKLYKVTGGSGVVTIEKSAFSKDTALKSVAKMARCKTIGPYAFYKCYKLATFSTGTATTSVGTCAFAYDKALTKISSLKKCVTIGDGAFYGCKKLRQIGSTKNRVSLYKISVIGKKAFRGCTALTSFYEHGTLTKLGTECFYGDKKLKTITLNSKLLTRDSVGKNAFKGIHSKAVIRVPASKKKVYQTYLKGKGQGKKVKIKSI